MAKLFSQRLGGGLTLRGKESQDKGTLQRHLTLAHCSEALREWTLRHLHSGIDYRPMKPLCSGSEHVSEGLQTTGSLGSGSVSACASLLSNSSEC